VGRETIRGGAGVEMKTSDQASVEECPNTLNFN